MSLTVRLTPGGEPEVEIHETGLKELDSTLREFRSQGVWSALKGAAREFADAPLAGVEDAVREALPVAEVVSDVALEPDEHQPQGGAYHLPTEAATVAEWNELAVDRAVKAGKIEQPTEQPKQTTPKCAKCGQRTTFASGTGKNGPWSAYFCSTGRKDHTTFLKK